MLAPQDGGKGRMLVTMLPGESAALPQATMDALRVPLGKPQRATLGGERATGYTALSLQGVNGLVDVYTLNTSVGLVAVTCIAPVDDPLPAGSCPADITALTVKVPRKAEPVDQLKAALPRLTTALNQARVSGRTALVAGGDTAAQQKAAASIATAYSAAATDAAKVAPKSGDGALLPDAFREAARSYGALATAASAGRRRRVGARPQGSRRRRARGDRADRPAELVARLARRALARSPRPSPRAYSARRPRTRGRASLRPRTRGRRRPAGLRPGG